MLLRSCPADGPAHPAGDCSVDRRFEGEACVDPVMHVVGEVAAVAAVEKVPNPFGTGANSLRDRRQCNRPCGVRVREPGGGTVEAPGLVAGPKGRVSAIPSP